MKKRRRENKKNMHSPQTKSLRHRIIGDVRYNRKEKPAHPYHHLPDELLTEIFTADPVALTARRLLHPRLAYVYRPFVMCRHPVHVLSVMNGFAKTYIALHTDLITPQTIMTPTPAASPCQGFRSRREVQVWIRRKAWRKEWRAENRSSPFRNGDARVVGQPFAKYALYAFLVQTVEKVAEPADEEFWEEFQLELCKRQERTRASSCCDSTVKRLHNFRQKRFHRLKAFLIALKYQLPVAINKMFKREHVKFKCEMFMADIFHDLVCHFIAQQREWHSYDQHFTVHRRLAVQLTEFRRQYDNTQMTLS